MASRKKKQPEPVLPKFIFTTQATYINNYVITGCRTQEEAEIHFEVMKDSEEEGDLICVQQLQFEEVLQVKEAM